jgi:protein SMG7
MFSYASTRPSLSPVVGPSTSSALPSPPLRLNPMSPTRANFSPIGQPNLTPTQPIGPLTPTHQRGQSSLSPIMSSTATTAQDLLNNVMGVHNGNDSSRTHHQESSAPQPQLLFGSGPPNLPGHSIWSTSLDNNQTAPGSYSGHVYHPSHHTASSQTMWSSSYSNPQTQMSSAPQPSSYTTQPLPIGTGSHHRSVSAQLSLPHQSQDTSHEPFGYSAPQSVIQRPGGHHHVHSLYSNPVMLSSSQTGMHFPHTSQDYHDPLIRPSFAPPPISQVWGSTG